LSAILEKWPVAAGQKLETFIEVGSDPLDRIRVPLWITVGAARGPTAGIVAGVHGSEYAGIRAAAKVYRHLQPKFVEGVVAIVPLANPAAFARRVAHVSPLDLLNLHKSFPGNPHGSITERIASAIFNDIALRSDYVFDLHGGDLYEAMLSHSLFYITGNEQTDAISRAMALHFTDRYIYPVMPVERPAGGNLAVETAKRGIPSIWSEAGSEGKVDKFQADKDLLFQTRGVLNVLRYLGILRDEPTVPTAEFVELSKQLFVRAERGGFFLPAVSMGETIRGGELIGEIRDLRDTTLQRIPCPFERAIIRLLHTHGVVHSGDVVAHICPMPAA
jgi:predicted deacylase